MIKLKHIIENTNTINSLSSDDRNMVLGIIELLNMVNDSRNRKSIALNQIQKFKQENIIFDYNEFMERIGCN